MLPVSERIAQKVFDRLQSMVNAQNSQVSEVIRPKRLEDYQPKNNQVVMYTPRPVKNEELSAPGNPPATAWDQTFNVHWVLLPHKQDPASLDSLRNFVLAEVMYHVCQPSSSWHNWDGLAINTTFGDPENADKGAEYAGVVVPIIVTYRVSENNPYQRR